MSPPTLRVRCYLDGFNFYYGVSRGYDIKWIDLEKLFQTILAAHIPNGVAEIEKIFLFTSTVRGEASKRQATYFSALKDYSSCIEIVRGHFSERTKKGPMVTRDDRGKIIDRAGEIVEIMIREKKCTDVNLACKIVDDAHVLASQDDEDKSFDLACLVSNDSDLSSALEIKKRLRQRVILISPRTEDSLSSISSNLKKYTDKKDRIAVVRKTDVENCLLPRKVGKYTPPDARGWSVP